MMDSSEAMLIGAVATASLVAAMIFLRFWRQTRDSFFLFFAASFALDSLARLLSVVLRDHQEREPLVYGLRLIAYGLIIVAIWRKNRRGG
jgi:hypothetical protein